MSNYASDKQINFIKKLLVEKDLDADTIETVNVELVNGLSVKGASFWIDQMMRARRKPAQESLALEVTSRARVSEPGFYKNDHGSVFKVVVSRQGNLYAKETTPSGLVYVAGAMGTLFADQKMTGEEIAEHGVANHYCVNCSTELEDPTSKRIGLGTSCGPSILGKEGYKRARAAVAHFEDVIAFEAAKKAKAKEARETKKLAQAQGEFDMVLV